MLKLKINVHLTSALHCQHIVDVIISVTLVFLSVPLVVTSYPYRCFLCWSQAKVITILDLFQYYLLHISNFYFTVQRYGNFFSPPNFLC